MNDSIGCNSSTCPTIGSQSATVCLPVSISPYAVTGPACVKCRGSAVINHTCMDCKGIVNGKCDFVISQKIQIDLPVEFGATVKVGDTYVDANGIGVGVVTSVDSSGLHGRVISSSGYRGTASEAQSLCVSKTTGDLDWGVASGDAVCSAAKNKHISLLFYATPCSDMPDNNADYCASSAVISPSSETSGICTASGFCGTWSICSGCTQHKCTQTSGMFYCEASF